MDKLEPKVFQLSFLDVFVLCYFKPRLIYSRSSVLQFCKEAKQIKMNNFDDKIRMNNFDDTIQMSNFDDEACLAVVW